MPPKLTTFEPPRKLTEDEKWGYPIFDRTRGAQIRVREFCQAPRGRKHPGGHDHCLNYAQYLYSGQKLCFSHYLSAKGSP